MVDDDVSGRVEDLVLTEVCADLTVTMTRQVDTLSSFSHAWFTGETLVTGQLPGLTAPPWSRHYDKKFSEN